MVNLIVLVHGLWGSVNHFDYITSQLESRGAWIHDPSVSCTTALQSSKTIVYRAKSNEGYFTYDGVDVCGTRLAREIELEIQLLAKNQIAVSQISIVGYSLGGLISRYAIGVLNQRGVFDQIIPVSYTSFCSPHVGVVALGSHWTTRLFNLIGTYSMASTSRQLFLADNFQNLGKPLLQYMADKSSPFYNGLAKFQSKTLYANITNDHRCEYYTSAISMCDPFCDHAITSDGPYVQGYDPIVLDVNGNNKLLFSLALENQSRSLISKTSSGFKTFLRITIGIPIWFLAFLCNAIYQTIVSTSRQRSLRRSNDHSSWLFEPDLDEVLEDEAEMVMDKMFETFSNHSGLSGITLPDEKQQEVTPLINTLVLTPCQRTIIAGLNSLGWHKFPVHIHHSLHTHAAVIVRYKNKLFDEGETVVRHWIENISD